MISLFSILVPNYVMDRKRDSASLLFSRDGSQTSKDFQNSGEVMVCRKKKCQSISSKIKAYINIIFYLNTIIAFHCVYMYFVYKSLLTWCKLTANKEKLSIWTLLLEHTTLWWYLQWPSGVSSLFSVSALAVYNHYLRNLSFLFFFSHYEGGEAPWVGLAPLGWE